MSARDAMANMIKNMKDINRLLQLHKEKGGAKPGRKYNLEVLNKSAIVLLVACWESFVEDLAEIAFDTLLVSAKTHAAFPYDVLTLSSRALKDSSNNKDVWALAGDGWRNVLKKHKATVLDQYIGKLNTPKPKQVDGMMTSLIGITSISQQWSWRGMSVDDAKDGLEALVTLRGSIAHKVSAAKSVLKADVISNAGFVYKLAVITSNRVLAYIHAKTGTTPWPQYQMGSVE